MPKLAEHQEEAKLQLGPGKVLYGKVGTGKTRTAIAYYVENEEAVDIYVITTARKRDSLDWEEEAVSWGISTKRELSRYGRLVVDSWNNIGNYVDVEGAFFIFDEQRAVGSGSWSKSFIKIGRKNHWILLSGTPGDSWMDYIPVFVANGYYRNKTDFVEQHVIWDPWSKFPKVKEYKNVGKLEYLRNEVLVEMKFEKPAKRYLNYMDVAYDKDLFNTVWKKRWNIYEEKPVKDMAEVMRLLRRIQNSDPSRLEMIIDLMRSHKRLIVFYNFDYELDILRQLSAYVPTYEYNGHRKNQLSEFEHEERWVYIVQYVAGAEAWNCVSTDAMVLYSLTYSYKNFEQVQGRIDRMNTPFKRLYYYVLLSNSWVDRRIKWSLEHKESFNERKAVLEQLKKEAQKISVVGGDHDETLEVCEI